MTPIEARAALMKRFPNSTVTTEMNCWYFNHSNSFTVNYAIAYNFHNNRCSRISGTSFEDCFDQLAHEDATINEVITKYSILLRNFN